MAKLTRESWICAGLEMLDLSGHPVLSVEQVARRLNVTRGSFYHHFQGRPEFVRALLERWVRDYTVAVIDQANAERDARRRLQRYVAVAAELEPGREVAIRTWAKEDPGVQAVLSRVDGLRIDFVRGLGRELLPQPSPSEIERFARIAYLAFIGLQQTGPHTKERFRDFINDLVSLTTGIAS